MERAPSRPPNTYDPFGNSRNITKVDPNAPTLPIGFEAQYLDPTGLYHLDARQMDPTTGSFLSTDPQPESSTLPATSVYLYADDQPTVLWDPSGQSWLGEAFSVTEGVAGGFECCRRDCGYCRQRSRRYVFPGQQLSPMGRR